MIACAFIMRDIIIKFNKGERIRLTHKIVCEVCNNGEWCAFFACSMFNYNNITKSYAFMLLYIE